MELFPLHWLLVGTVILVIMLSFYKYFFSQNYIFLVESECDPTTQECYSRDCENEYCPPNNFSTYQIHRVPAAQFSSCTDNTCSNVCDGGGCLKELCSSQSDIECVGPDQENS